jgi:hypothetical protein
MRLCFARTWRNGAAVIAIATSHFRRYGQLAVTPCFI